VANAVIAEKTPYFGNASTPVIIKELVRLKNKIDSTVAFGDRRIVFNGTLCVDHVQNSLKWGNEITINLWTRDFPKFEQRAKNDGYSRVAISLKPTEALALCERLLEKLWGII